MTRYSASRGILYSAPPGPSGDPTTESESTADAQGDDPVAEPPEAAETTAADAEAKADD